MNISYLSGIDGCASCGLGAPSTVKQTLSKAKTTAKKVTQGAKVVGLSAGRLLFLTMIKNNLDGIASKLATGNTTNQLAIWKKAGGDGSKFANALKVGASKPAKKFGFLGKLKGRLARRKISGLFGAETEDQALNNGIRAIAIATGTAVGSSAPAVGNVVGAGAGASLGEVLVIILPIIKEAVVKTPSTEALSENAPFSSTGLLEGETSEAETGMKPMEEETKDTYNKVLLYGAIAVGGYFLYKKFMK